MSVRPGDIAPDFTLDGIDGRTGDTLRFSLSDASGAPLVVAFYPADNSPVCTKQLVDYTERFEELDRLGAQVVAISPQSIESHREFAAGQGGFAFPLLADEGKEVGRRYGILGLLDLYRRSTFVVDAGGRIAYAHRFVGPGVGYKGVDELARVVSGT